MATPINTQTRASDRPIDDADHDDFQRDPFALRIAQTLIDRQSPESIVIGLYGKWGEGKTSVLQLLRKSLNASDKVAVMEFNPWRFSDETQLLTNFFAKLAQTIGKNLHTAKERAVQSIGKYTKYITPLLPTLKFGLPLVGGIELDPEKIGKSLEAVAEDVVPDLEELKERIEQLIKESKRRVIIIIDDIDRLEKKQIQAIFRLVKLTADFQQTAYLLAFDDVMVARAIGEIFTSSDLTKPESGPEQAGQNFLEKIIQVPLRLPRARPDDLLQFCWNRLQEVLTETNTLLTEADQERLVDALRSGILPRLTTPRLAVRFANAVQFSLPLLRGEVNSVDQLLVEAMHIFYAQLHHYVATHESVFGGSTENNRFHYLAGKGKSHEEKHQELVEAGLKHYEGDERAGAISLLCALFPRISELYRNSVPLFGRRSNPTADELIHRQAVAAPTHFARYFAYAVIRGDISDQEFGEFLAQPTAAQLTTAQDLLTLLGANTFLLKIQYRIPNITPDQAANVWAVLIELSPAFSGIPGPFAGRVSSQLGMMAKLLLQLLEKMPKEEERFSMVINLVSTGGTFDLVQQVRELLYRRNKAENEQAEEVARNEGEISADIVPLFSKDEWNKTIEALPEQLLSRAIAEAEQMPLYKSHPSYAHELLFTIWARTNRQPDVATYVRRFLAQAPSDIHDLLAVCSSQLVMGGREFAANLTTDAVKELTGFFGPNLYDIARKLLGDEMVTVNPSYDPDQPSKMDRLRQFVYLYENLEKSSAITQE